MQAGLGQAPIRKGGGWHMGEAPAWALVAGPCPVLSHFPAWLSLLACHRLQEPPEAPLSAPSLRRAPRYSQLPETTMPWGGGQRQAPAAPPPPRPHSTGTSFSVLILQSCTRRELGVGGWGVTLWVSCLFICLI